VSKQTGKGSRHHRRASRDRAQGDAAPGLRRQADVERAEAEFRKHDRLQAEENHQVVREMAAEIEKAAGVKGDGRLGARAPARACLAHSRRRRT